MTKRDLHSTRIGAQELRPESLMMGYGYRPELSEGAIKCPVFQTSTFVLSLCAQLVTVGIIFIPRGESYS